MVNVKGGFCFVDLSVYGAFTSGTAKTGQDVESGAVFAKTQQTDKMVIICGLTVGTTHYPPIAATFVSTTSSGTTTATAVTPVGTFEITNTGSIEFTVAS